MPTRATASSAPTQPPRAIPVLAAVALACACALPRVARAEALSSAPRGTPQVAEPTEIYDLSLAVDLPLIAASGMLASSWLLRGELAPPHCAPRCDRATLPGFDRGAAGLYDEDARNVSDAGVATVIVGSTAFLLLDGGLVEFAVGAEAVLATSAVVVLTMMAVRRPRPFAYGEEAPLSARLDGNAGLAFPSGHTANAFAATLATFHSLHTHHPRSAWPWVFLGGGVLLSSAVGASRVLAGDHFPSDVVAGAVLGTTIGWLVPELHRIAPGVSVAPGAGASLTLSGNF